MASQFCEHHCFARFDSGIFVWPFSASRILISKLFNKLCSHFLRVPGISPATRAMLQKIPLLTVKATPRDGDQWIARLKEEYSRLIEYIKINKEMDNDWFKIESNKTGTRWKGTCWYFHENTKYEFDLQFEIPVTYPVTPIELELPELDGKTSKMYRGGKICLTIHFKPLWAKNAPHFGIAHALALGLAPWMAAEVPHLVSSGVLSDKVKSKDSDDQKSEPASAAAASSTDA